MEEQMRMVSADKHSPIFSRWHRSLPGCEKRAGLLPDEMPPPVSTDFVQDFVMLGLNPSLGDAGTIPLLLL